MTTRPGSSDVEGAPRAPRGARTLRLLTYNVHSCVGLDRKLSVERVAEVIAMAGPDVVALQELDVNRVRTGRIDQAHLIAETLRMNRHFFAALEVEEERYGDAVLSRFPMRLVRAERLPDLALRLAGRRTEPRGALWVEVDWAGVRLQLVNTHLGLRAKERWLQIDALLGPRWLEPARLRGPAVLCGDLNAIASSRVCRRLGGSMSDAQASVDGHRPRRTYRAGYPLLRIDHVYTSAGLVARRAAVPDHALARVASDHLPLVVDLELVAPDPEAQGAVQGRARRS